MTRKNLKSPRLATTTGPREEITLTDCLQCVHFINREIGLISCENRVVPGPNCKDENIQCVNYKPR